MCGIYIQWNSSALKRKEILAYATTGKKLEEINVCEINQSEKDKYCMIQLYEVSGRIELVIET